VHQGASDYVLVGAMFLMQPYHARSSACPVPERACALCRKSLQVLLATICDAARFPSHLDRRPSNHVCMPPWITACFTCFWPAAWTAHATAALRSKSRQAQQVSQHALKTRTCASRTRRGRYLNWSMKLAMTSWLCVVPREYTDDVLRCVSELSRFAFQSGLISHQRLPGSTTAHMHY
jgi:hypothetical protein